MNKTEQYQKLQNIMAKNWEKSNRELDSTGGVNPHAYKLGFSDAFNFIIENLDNESAKKLFVKLDLI